MNTDPAQFQRFLTLIPDEIKPHVWFIPLGMGLKSPDIPKGESTKDEKYRLTPEKAFEWIKRGHNVGIYATPGGLLFLDADTDKGNIVLPEEIRKTIPATLTIKTRNGGLQYYFINNGAFKNKVHTYNGKNAGEIRADWYYVLAPGSYVKPDEDAGKDAEGVYKIINDAPIIKLDKLPAGITVKEDIPKKKIEIKPQHTWKNEIGMSLDEIRKKDDKLDKLLSGACELDYPSRSEADLGAAQKLYFWRFNESEIAGILQEYRPYEKTERKDYVETTISKIVSGDRYNPEYHKNCGLDVGDISEQTQNRRYNKQAKMDLSGLPATNFLLDYIGYAARMTDAYVEYHVAGGLMLLALAADRKIRVRFAHETIYPNLFQATIGDSTISRKTASISIMYDKIAKAVFDSNKFLPQSSSPESLIEELSNNSKASLIRDEAGGFLRELDKNYMQGFKDVLCSLYDNRGFHRKIRTSQRKSSQTDFDIKNPFINIYFATTPDVFKTYSNFLDVSSGWLVRFLYYTPEYEKAWRGYRKETIDDLNQRDELRRSLELIKLRVEALPDELDYELSDDALQFFTAWQERTEKEAMKAKDKNKLRILGRLHTYAIKISMLFLLGDNTDNTTISKKYIEIACRMMEEYFVINACALLEDIARDEKNNLQDKVISILKTYGRTSVRDLMRYAHQPKKDLGDALDALDENGSFEIKKTKVGKSVFYELNVANVTTVPNVTKVPFVANNQGINATNVTMDIEHRRATPFQSTSCDKSDKCDNRDRRDSCDNPVKTCGICSNPLNGSECERGAAGLGMVHTACAKTWQMEKKIEQGCAEWEQVKGQAGNSINQTEAVFWVCDRLKLDPSVVRPVLERLFKITPSGNGSGDYPPIEQTKSQPVMKIEVCGEVSDVFIQ